MFHGIGTHRQNLTCVCECSSFTQVLLHTCMRTHIHTCMHRDTYYIHTYTDTRTCAEKSITHMEAQVFHA
jgi:hypothetical protein